MGKQRRRFAWIVAAILALWTIAPEAQEDGVLVMVVYKANPANRLTAGEARKLLIGETKTWPNGQDVVVMLTPPGSPARIAVLKKICGMTEALYTRYEMQANFTGQTVAKIAVSPTDAAVKAAVKSNPGAVGFLPKNMVDDSVKAVREFP